jgi:phosphate transport system permease protein
MKNKRLNLSDSQHRWELIFKRILVIVSIVMLVLVVGILITLIMQSMPSIKALGFGYLWGKVWDPVQNIYGAIHF